MERELLEAHPGRTGRVGKTGSSRRKEAVDDQQQDPIGQNAFRQWRATSGSGAESGSFYPNALPLVAWIRTLLTRDFFPFRELSATRS
jgi:hypothetical protein